MDQDGSNRAVVKRRRMLAVFLTESQPDFLTGWIRGVSKRKGVSDTPRVSPPQMGGWSCHPQRWKRVWGAAEFSTSQPAPLVPSLGGRRVGRTRKAAQPSETAVLLF